MGPVDRPELPSHCTKKRTLALIALHTHTSWPHHSTEEVVEAPDEAPDEDVDVDVVKPVMVSHQGVATRPVPPTCPQH